MRSPGALAVPRPADLDAIDDGDDVVIARRADDFAAREIADYPGQHVAVSLPLDGVVDVSGPAARVRHARVPQLPQLAVRGRGFQRRRMIRRHRLQSDAIAFQDNGFEMNHGTRL